MPAGIVVRNLNPSALGGGPGTGTQAWGNGPDVYTLDPANGITSPLFNLSAASVVFPATATLSAGSFGTSTAGGSFSSLDGQSLILIGRTGSSGSAISTVLNSSHALNMGNDLLLSVQNNGTERFGFRWDGTLIITPVPAAPSQIIMFDTSGGKWVVTGSLCVAVLEIHIRFVEFQSQ
jgi:hypothetical protein